MNPPATANPFAQRTAPALANHWRRWLYVLMAALLLSTFIQLGHDHSAHKAGTAADCAICQHSVSLDKALPSQLPLLLLVFGLALGFVAIVSAVVQPAPCSFNSRAPPAYSA